MKTVENVVEFSAGYTSTSGFQPLEYKVVVKPDPIEEKTKGGIILTDTMKDKEQLAAQRGTVDAVSPIAFDWEGWEGSTPRPGSKVVYARYAGVTMKGADGEEYRIVSDKDIWALEG